MNLKRMYGYIASGDFKKVCSKNDIDLKDTSIKLQIGGVNSALWVFETRLSKSPEDFLLKEIERLVFSFFINGQENLLFSDDFYLLVLDKTNSAHEFYQE